DQYFGPAFELYLITALNVGRSRAGRSADHRADGRAFAAAGDAADDRAQGSAAARTNRGRFTSAATLDIAFFVHLFDRFFAIDFYDLGGHGDARAIFQKDSVEREREFGLSGKFARLVNFRNMPLNLGVGVPARREHNRGEWALVSRFLGVNFTPQPDLHL